MTSSTDWIVRSDFAYWLGLPERLGADAEVHRVRGRVDEQPAQRAHADAAADDDAMALDGVLAH